MSEVGNRLLDALQPDELALLRLAMTRVRLRQGNVIQGGAPIEHVFFPTAGIVSLVANFENGDAIEIAAIGRDGAIGTKVGLHPQLSFSSAVVQLLARPCRWTARDSRKPRSRVSPSCISRPAPTK